MGMYCREGEIRRRYGNKLIFPFDGEGDFRKKRVLFALVKGGDGKIIIGVIKIINGIVEDDKNHVLLSSK